MEPRWIVLIACVVSGLAQFIVIYFVFMRRQDMAERCTMRTIGEVLRMSYTRYNGLYLPVVGYTVEGKEYTVVGPRFQSTTELSITTPNAPHDSEVSSNIPETGPVPTHASVHNKKNRFLAITRSPLMDRYPKGTRVTVYYNPDKPKEAFVERFEGVSKVAIAALSIAGLGSIIVGIILFFVLGR